MNLYVAADPRYAPIITSSGYATSYGDFLLEASKLFGGIPFSTGIADINGDASLSIPIPNVPEAVGWHVAVQALAIDPLAVSGQLSRAHHFEIES